MAEHAVGLLNEDDGGVVGGPWIDAEPTGRSLGAARALLAGMALIMMGNGLQAAVLGVRAENEGFGPAISGAVMAGFFLGFLFGAKMAEHFLGAVGHIRVFAALASLASAVSILHPLWVNPPAWVVLRVLFGLAMAGIYVTVESWLNDMGTNANRGRLLGTYLVVSMGGLAGGQLLLNGGDPVDFDLFIFSSVLISVALLPIALSASSAPPLVAPEPLPLRHLIALVPTGVLTAFCAGTSHGALLGVGAVYAAREGLSAARISLFLSVATLGAIVFTWPTGALSDRISRRVVILAVAAVAAGVAGVMVWIEPGSPLSLAFMFLFGGTTFPLYSLAITHTADWVPSNQLNGASAGLVRMTGVGAVLGPVAAGLAMALIAPWAFFVVLVAPHALIALFIGGRIAARKGILVNEQSEFSPWPVRASAMAVNLLRRPPRPRRTEAGSVPSSRPR
ncbi:MFS transporter [Candidatus Poriferisocius sp.]|uniref:MFS transporter n=1 Tax=Candidatus Poriferisocius sp. TaxID=3101276 RepID=UPI003B5AB6B4